MGGLQHEVFAAVDELPFALGVRAPQHKDYVLTFPVESGDGGIGQFFPTFALVTASLMRLDSERSVQQQHPLLRPAAQISGCRDGDA